MTGTFIQRACMLLCLGAAAAGCSTVADVAHDTAVQDLRCPKDDVRMTREDPSALASPSHFLASGCGRYINYVCYPVGKASYKCFPDEPARTHAIDGGVD